MLADESMWKEKVDGLNVWLIGSTEDEDSKRRMELKY